MSEQLCPKPLVIIERFRFFKRQQAVGERVSEYCAVLQKLSETCDFGGNLEDSLCDRLVCGIRSDQSQKRLLTEKNLTFKKAKEMALAMEMAIKDTKELQVRLVAPKTPIECTNQGITVLLMWQVQPYFR